MSFKVSRSIGHRVIGPFQVSKFATSHEILDVQIVRKIKKPIMAKLSEYLKHHREHACSEIRTPLVSENLVDSGASRWDASFVNVDKEGCGWGSVCSLEISF